MQTPIDIKALLTILIKAATAIKGNMQQHKIYFSLNFSLNEFEVKGGNVLISTY